MIRPLIALALTASVVTAPAFAASDEFQMNIDYQPAKLQTIEEASAEYDRIREDVHDRCVEENVSVSLIEGFAVSRCESKLMNKVVAFIDNDNFTAAHEAAR